MTITFLAAYAAIAGHTSAALPSAMTRLQDPKPAEQKKEEEDPYAKAIKDYTASQGVFQVFRNKESVLYEIPKNMLGRDFLWTTELKQTPGGMYNGTSIGEGVVRWTERDEKIILQLIDFTARATEGDAIKTAVAMSNAQPILQAFDIKARSKTGGILIDVGKYLKTDIPEFSARGAVGGTNQDNSRSFLDKIVAFPININAEVTMTFNGGPPNPAAAIFGGPRGGGPKTAVVYHSMVLLPETPMMPRIKDSRVGYFSTAVSDFGLDYHGVKEYELINRYNLVKKDPSAELSEPVKPIVYYLSREIPEKWRPYLKKGVEDWQVAFEAAGFKNAIICKDAPTEKEDPDWSPEDARFSVIRWAPLPIANAMGPHVTDPRSGEIISAHVIFWHDILKLQTDWYFAQASPNDKRAQRLPLPDDLQGELLRFVSSHEVGHTLGLPHNGKSSSTVSVQQLRDPKWTTENGTATSIMDYARFNYVAQPGDNAALIPKIGKYDKFSIAWGYRPITSARTPWDETPVLDSWASAQVTDPQLRFYDNFNSSDPTALSEALGSNAVDASTLGVKNLKRVMSYVKPASVRTGEDYSELERMHGAVVQQFMMYVSHVMAVVGGIEQIDYHGNRGGAVYNPVSLAYQKSAVQWLIDNAMTPPTFLFPKDILDKFSPDMGLNRQAQIQSMAVNGLLNDARLNRMMQNEAVGGASAFSVMQMMGMIRGAAWSGLRAKVPVLGLDARNLQRAWINGLTRKLGVSGEIRAMAMAELEAELAMINTSLPKTTDLVTRGHLRELKKQIEFCLANPDKAAPAPVAPTGGRNFIEDFSGCFLCNPRK